MANDQINQYPITAVTIEDESFFDIDQWTGAAFESQKVPATLMASVFGVNIGNSDLQCTDPIRKLLLQGTDPDGVRFSVRNSADTLDFFRVAGGGVITFNEAFSFPLVDGAIGEVLTTNGSGAVSWAAGGGADTNIGTNDLTISATGVRELQMFDALTTSQFNLRNSADTQNLFSFGGEGTMAIGLNALNTGTNSARNVVIGQQATNGGFEFATDVGYQAGTTANGGTALGYVAKAGAYSTAIGYYADASAGQYNIAVGQNASCSAYYGVAIGRYASAADRGLAIGNGSVASAYATAISGTTTGGYSVAVGYLASTSGHGTAVGYNTACTNIGVALGRGMETSGIYSVSIGACPYGSTRLNAVANTFNWFTNNADPIVRFGETADQWNIGTGSFGYGTMTPDASAIVQMDSTTKGFLPPVMRTAEKGSIASPATGLMVFDSDLGKLCVYTGAAWETVTSV